MSFILDALRKSENERQRNQQPGLAVSQVPQARKASAIWLPLVALLVGINLSLLIVMWFMSSPQQPAQAPAPAVTPPAAVAPVTAPPAAARAAAPAAADTIAMPSGTAPVTVPGAMPGTPTFAGPDAADELPAALPAGPEPAMNMAESPAGPTVPTMEELILANLITVPELNMDIHVYSEVPKERFVFINMNRYNEGQTLAEGPALIEITPEGVILRHQGYDFLVTREQ